MKMARVDTSDILDAVSYAYGDYYRSCKSNVTDAEAECRRAKETAEKFREEGYKMLDDVKALKEKKDVPTPDRILKSGDRTIVFWSDGEKTIVKRAPDEPESDYAAFTAALGIKVYGSNSALKRIVERTETQKPKKKQNNVQADA